MKFFKYGGRKAMDVYQRVNAEYTIVEQQMESFNNYITNLNSNTTSDAEQKEMERISKIIETAIGVIASLLEKQQNDQNTSSAYTKGKGGGSLIGSAIAKGVAGTIVVGGYVSKHFYLGIGGAAACLALDCMVATIYLNYLGYKTASKAEEIKSSHEQLNPIYNQAQKIQSIILLYTKLRTSPEMEENESKLKNKAASCLQLYQLLPANLKDDTAYFRMLSLFIQRLPVRHPIRQQLEKACRLALTLFEKQVQISKSQVNIPIDPMKNIAEEKSNIVQISKSQVNIPIDPMKSIAEEKSNIKEANDDDNNATIVLLENKKEEVEFENNDQIKANSFEDYSDSLKKCHQLIRDHFYLKPNQSIRFVEAFGERKILLVGSPIYRMTQQGISVYPLN
jgi:hypothetical protein